MALITSEKGLLKLDEALEAITKGLAIEAGSLFRVPFQYLKNWGIKVTDSNKPFMEERAEACNQREWKYGSGELEDAINGAIADAKLNKNNVDLNTLVGTLTARIFSNWDDGKRKFAVIDVGAGAGDTTDANLDKIGSVFGEVKAQDLVSRMDWCLNDQSLPRLHEAHEKLEMNPLRPRNLYYLCAPMGAVLDRMKNGTVDMFISSAVFHHMPSTTHLMQIRDKLSPDGVLVIGDWYHTFCAHPAYTLKLLFNIGADKDRIDAFKRLFEIEENSLRDFKKTLSPSQIRDNEAALIYLSSLGHRMKSIMNAKFFFLESLESFQDRQEKLTQAGFETEIRELRKKHKAFERLDSNITRAYSDSNITSVIAVGKIPRKRDKVVVPKSETEMHIQNKKGKRLRAT